MTWLKTDAVAEPPKNRCCRRAPIGFYANAIVFTCDICPRHDGSCACTAGFTGTFCEIADPCLDNPCINGYCAVVGDSKYLCNFT